MSVQCPRLNFLEADAETGLGCKTFNRDFYWLNCVPTSPIPMLKLSFSVPQNSNVFGDRVWKEVIRLKRLLVWDLIPYDRCPCKTGRLEQRHTQGEDDRKTQEEEEDHLQPQREAS